MVLDPSFLNAVNTNVLPVTDNTYDLGSSTYRWRNLYLSGALVVAGDANVGSLQVGGTTVIDSGRNVVNIVSVNSSLLTPGQVFLLAQPVDADSTDTLRSSPNIVLRAKYWTGTASANFDVTIRHVIVSTEPLSKLSFVFGGVERAFIVSDGSMNIGSLLVGGRTVIGSDRSLRNIVGVAQSLLPSSDNTYDLGSSTYRWRNLYLGGALVVAGAANVGSLQVGGTTVIDSSRNLQNVNWISGVMRRDTGQEIFRCQNDALQTFYFALRNAANTIARDHCLAPLDDISGYWGISSNRWFALYSFYVGTWKLDFRGSDYSHLPLDPYTHHYLVPYVDGYSYIGTSTNRFYYIRGLTVVSGDIGFEDRRCLVCGREFKEGDAVVLKVRKVDDENMQVLAVPVHAECNPHPLDPELLREHEKLLTPNRSGVRYELNPPGPGEFEVISVTVEDENTMMVNVVYGDGRALSFPAPVDADEETITKLASEYYNIVKGREADREAKIARGRAKLKREWRGYKGKIVIREVS